MRGRQAAPVAWPMSVRAGGQQTRRFTGKSGTGVAGRHIKVSSCGPHHRNRPRGDGSAADGVVLDLTTGTVRDGVLQVDPVALRDSEQVGGAPDDIVLELRDLAV